MRRILFVSLLLMLRGKGSSSFVTSDGPRDPVPWRNLKVSEFLRFSTIDYNPVAGKRFNLKQRIEFTAMKIGMRRALKRNQNITVDQYLATPKKPRVWLIALIILGFITLTILILALAVASGL
jgi:hypothetical protein